MKAFIKFLSIDKGIQLTLLTITGFSAFTIIGLMITMPVLGAWQVLSGVVGYYYLRDHAHAAYLGACALVFCGMWATINFDVLNESFLPFFVFILIPAIMAYVYYKITVKTLDLVKNDYIETHDLVENILDDELVLG